MTLRQILAIAVLGLTASCVAPPPEQADAAAPRRSPLQTFYDALDALQKGRTSRVAILQIGDSHTANDSFSSEMRNRFQERFGNAGRGMLPPGIPFKYYRPSQVTVTATGWRTIGSLDPSNPGPFGLSGVRQSATKPAEMTLRADEAGGFDRVVIEALGQPNGGIIEAIPDSGPTLTLKTNGHGALFLEVPAHDGLTLRTRGGPVDILSWTALRDHPGVTYSNLGTISATVDLIGRWDTSLMSAEIARLRPALILVAFGTNEGFKDTNDPAEYAPLYASRVQTLHRLAPAAAIVIMGPPDGARHAAASTCPRVDAATWAIPPRLPELRAVQRRFAQANGYVYWDWSAAMGGPCSIQRWALTEPPMAAPDHVHLFAPGYRATADQLFDTIMAGYGTGR